MTLKSSLILVLSSSLSFYTFAGEGSALIGWQTFDASDPTDNNSGVADNTPDTNSTYDSSPVGGISASNHYLSADIGPGASNQGWTGLGIATNNDFLNGPRFGGVLNGDYEEPPAQNGELIVNWPLAGSNVLPGTRIGPYEAGPNGGPIGTGTVSWKFGNNADLSQSNRLKGDISITNNSDYYFRLEFMHYLARTLENPSAPNKLEVKYLASPGSLIKKTTGLEVVNLKPISTILWDNALVASGEMEKINQTSRSLGGVADSAVYIPPGEKAAFRFLWSGETGSGQAQLDNIAFEGTFFETAALVTEIDPAEVPEEVESVYKVPTLPIVFQWLFAGVLALISFRKFPLLNKK
ncbi:hypothetical protein N9W57_07210 [Pseudomonadales bacterium]|nr:hypothetical protein [Pseudomonadales bacterium]MDG1937653.1 hypothetical protein [Pseudomonadales bacterium]